MRFAGVLILVLAAVAARPAHAQVCPSDPSGSGVLPPSGSGGTAAVQIQGTTLDTAPAFDLRLAWEWLSPFRSFRAAHRLKPAVAPQARAIRSRNPVAFRFAVR